MEEMHRRHTSEFKKKAVLLSYESKNVAGTAKKLGISPKLLSKWRGIYKTVKKGSFPGKGQKREYFENIEDF